MLNISENEIYIKQAVLGKINLLILIFASFPILKPLNLINRFILHLELPRSAYDNRIRMPHPFNIVINGRAVLGNNITIYHNTTIGSKQWGGEHWNSYNHG